LGVLKRMVISLLLVAVGVQSENQYPLWAEGGCEFADNIPNINHGANRSHYNSGAGLGWKNYLGDWADVNATSQGDNAYSSTYVSDTDSQKSFDMDTTSLVQEWVNGTHPNQGLLLRNSRTPNSKTDIHSKEANDENFRPVLSISTNNGEFLLTPIGDTMVRSYTYQCGGSLKVLRLLAPSNVLMQFNIDDIPMGSIINNATLTLNTTENQYGHNTVELYRVSIEAHAIKGQTLSSAYPNDFGMKYDDSILLVESFDTDNWQGKWQTQIENTVVFSGEGNGFVPLMGGALKATVKKDTFYGLNLIYDLENSHGEDLDELNMRYYLRFGENWKPNDIGKLPGIVGTYGNTPYEGGWGGRTSDGENGWSARGLFGYQIEGNNPHEGKYPIGNYIYHADQAGSYGDGVVFQSEPLAQNEWYAIEQYVKMNTPSLNDGIIRSWVNGVMVYENKTFRFRNEGFENIKVEKVWMNIYHGGKKTANQDITAYIDNVVIAKKYIGPVDYKLGAPLVGSESNRIPIIDSSTPYNNIIALSLGASQQFSIAGSDPERSSLQTDWYVNGKLVLENQNSFIINRVFDNLDAINIEARIIDGDGGVATKSWDISSELNNFFVTEVIQDTYLPTWTHQARGFLDTMISRDTSNILMEFPFNADLDANDIKSAYIVISDKAQYGDINVSLFKGVGNWIEGTHAHQGASSQYQDFESSLPWNNLIGDWIDASGIENGSDSYSEIMIEDNGPDAVKKVYIDVTTLLKEQIELSENLDVVLTATGGKHDIYTKQAEEYLRPKLIIEKYEQTLIK
jgi:hypothetical protein